MAKEQKAVEPAAHSTGDPHAVYPTHYDVKIHTCLLYTSPSPRDRG